LLLNDGDLPGSGAGTVNIVPSPEPPSILLLGTALLLGAGFITVRRRMIAEIAE
jgi:LPXTG-motif cell wall-anchored protein